MATRARSLRAPLELWAQVADAAEVEGATVNAWAVRVLGEEAAVVLAEREEILARRVERELLRAAMAGE